MIPRLARSGILAAIAGAAMAVAVYRPARLWRSLYRRRPSPSRASRPTFRKFTITAAIVTTPIITTITTTITILITTTITILIITILTTITTIVRITTTVITIIRITTTAITIHYINITDAATGGWAKDARAIGTNCGRFPKGANGAPRLCDWRNPP
jgi:hypothetical protein